MASKDRDSKRNRVVIMPTAVLQEQLNRAYGALRLASSKHTLLPDFDRLWDLKELALLEGRHSVEIPAAWLDELDELWLDPQEQMRWQ